MAFKDIMPHDDLPWRDNAVYLAASTVARGQSRIGGLFVWLYRWRPLRHSIMRLCRRVESSLMFSVSWRRVLQQYHGVEVGAYSYGDVLRAGALPPGSKVGRYCSVGQYLIVRRRDHPVESVIMHPVFYNHKLGFLLHDTIPDESENPLIVGHGVWIGDRVTVLGGCRSIGNGAVVAAGSVVTRDVEPYSIVGGVPARKIKSRFSDSDCYRIESSEWWNIDLDELITMLSE